MATGLDYGLSLRRKALPILESKTRKRREILGEDDPETIGSLNSLAIIIADNSRKTSIFP